MNSNYMTEDSISRRGFLGKTAAVGAAALAGCSAPNSSSEPEYDEEILESNETSNYETNELVDTKDSVETYDLLEGETNDDLGLYLEGLDAENETADIYLIAGSTQTYQEGDQIVCDRTEEAVSAYLEEINFEMDEVSLRLEQGC